jgi:PH (Pleckstrin Homology) domain-containing protein
MRTRRVPGGRTTRETSPILLRGVLPLWFRVFFTVMAPPFLAYFVMLILAWVRRGFSPIEFFEVPLALLVIVSGGYFLPICLSSYIASEAGVERVRVLGARQHLAWEDIVEVRDSRLPLRFPRDAAYIVSRTGETMAVSKSMPQYRELLRLIEARAPNLTTRPSSPDIEPHVSAWRSLRSTVASAVVLYLIAKALYIFWWR